MSDFIIRDGVLERYIGTDRAVRIPEGVREISARVFANLDLREVYLPYGLQKIGKGAFSRCTGIGTVTLPITLEELGDRAFYGCSSLTTLYGAGSLLSIGDSAFEDCTELLNVELPNKIEKIGARAFASCSELLSISLPDALKFLGEEAFSDCESLVSAEIPGGLAEVSDRAFYKCKSLKEVRLGSGIRRLGVRCFSLCRFLEEIAIPESVKELGEGVFEGCGLLKTANIPDGITVIPPTAFNSCGLTHVHIPEGVVEIGAQAFEYNFYMNGVRLPSTLRRIGMHAFASCASVNPSTIPDKVESIGVSAFSECDFGKVFVVPKGMSELGAIFGDGCPEYVYATHLSIDKIHTRCRKGCLFGLCGAIAKGAAVEDEVFDSYLRYARRTRQRLYDDISDKPEVIDFFVKNGVIPTDDIDYLLELCTDFAESRALLLSCKNERTVPDEDTALDELSLDGLVEKRLTVTDFRRIYSFKYREDGTVIITSYKGNDRRVTVPACIGGRQVSEIGRYAFSPKRTKSTDRARSTARLLEAATLPDGIEVIGEGAFCDCKNLESINIPHSVHTVGDHAFCGCLRLGHPIFEGNTRDKSRRLDIGASAFLDCDSFVKLVLPEGTVLSEQGVFWHCSSLEAVELPESVTELRGYVFGMCPVLKTVTVRAQSITLSSDFLFSSPGNITLRIPKDAVVKGCDGFVIERY